MLVRVDPSGSTRMLSIPRDLWVSIPGHGEDKINAAYALGGPRLMVETVKQNLGVTINNYVEIDFVGFQALVDELGGIEIDFPYPARDAKSGLDVDAGVQNLDGSEALAYARSRSYQELQNGSWVSVDANDIGRTGRQQDVMRALLGRLKSPSSITEAGSIASAMSQHMTIDAKLAEESVPSMVWDFRGVLTGSIDGETLPTTGADDRWSARFRSGRTPKPRRCWPASGPVPPPLSPPLTVEVLNGSTTAGAAGAMSERLQGLGFEVASVGNAGTNSYAETTVIVPEGSDDGGRHHRGTGIWCSSVRICR